MVTDQFCQYCWQPTSIGGHNDGCPLANGTPEAMKQWEDGYAYGWSDTVLRWWQYAHYPATFLLGHRAGKNAIDKLIDDVAQARFSYHHDEIRNNYFA